MARLTTRRLALPFIAAALASLACPPATLAATVGATPPGHGSGPPALVCGLAQRAVQQASGGVQVISRANGFDTSDQPLCIRPAPGGRPGFTVLDSLRYTGAWQAYPFTGYGCAYSLCSPGTALPRQVSRLPSWISSSFSWHQNLAAGSWNASYDIWLDDSDQIRTEDDGAELMIWLRPNTSMNSSFRLVRVGGRLWWFTHWRTCDKARICWNYVQFRFTGPWLARHHQFRVLQGVRGLRLMPFFAFLEHQGLIRPSWWLTSVHAGYEIVSGGKGLTTTWFNVHV
jgi:Glycosyl hydrolase family 12